MRILVFDSEITGHHLEYMHHLYEEACLHPEVEVLFLTNRDFEKVKNEFVWPKSENVSVLYLTEKEQFQCNNSNLLLAAWMKSLIIRRYVLRHKINCVWLIMFIQLMPFLPFLIPRGVKISGILYRIFLYDKDKSKGLRKWMEKLRFTIIAHHRSIQRVYVLNDQRSADKLNSIFYTKKFLYIPDPIPVISKNEVINLRESLGISIDQRLYIHFGFIEKRKGTLELLLAIDYLSEEQIKDKYFIIAGKIKDDFVKDFQSILERNRNRNHIIVYNQFCSYQFLNNLCYSCDAIIIPYHKAIHSSGVIGYASFFNKPVIGPSEGLLGDLIQEYNLGFLLREISPECIASAICKDLPKGNEEYANNHKICDFVKVFYERNENER